MFHVAYVYLAQMSMQIIWRRCIQKDHFQGISTALTLNWAVYITVNQYGKIKCGLEGFLIESDKLLVKSFSLSYFKRVVTVLSIWLNCMFA